MTVRAPVAALALLSLALTACNPGAYPVDIFPEMHYQVSQRRLEPERLAAPAGSVPVTGGTIRVSWQEAANMANPVQRNAQVTQRAQQLYRENCAMCHGADGKGQSVVATHFQRAGRVPPVDFSGPRARSRTDGQLHWIVTNGLGGMPPFGNILSEEERWTLVYFVRGVQGQ